ncbi:MAG: hypothetical protein R2795_10510 [Saprospiraceae bacterium]
MSFQTGCQPNAVTWEENFDNQSICSPLCGSACPLTGSWINTAQDDADWLVWTGNTNTNTGYTDNLGIGGKYLYLGLMAQPVVLAASLY